MNKLTKHSILFSFFFFSAAQFWSSIRARDCSKCGDRTIASITDWCDIFHIAKRCTGMLTVVLCNIEDCILLVGQRQQFYFYFIMNRSAQVVSTSRTTTTVASVTLQHKLTRLLEKKKQSKGEQGVLFWAPLTFWNLTDGLLNVVNAVICLQIFGASWQSHNVLFFSFLYDCISMNKRQNRGYSI